MRQHNKNFTPEKAKEELLMLAGRVEAVGAYLENEKYPSREVIAAILGIDLQEEMKDAKDNSTVSNS